MAIKYKSVLHKAFENSKIRKPKNIILYKAAHTLDEIHNYCVYDECKEIKQKVELNGYFKTEEYDSQNKNSMLNG